MKTTAERGIAATILFLGAGCATGAPPGPAAAATTATAAAASPTATAPPPSPVAPPAPATPGVRVLVTIVVDQLAAWLAGERWPQLPADGGFARLRREGLYVRELHYDHAATDTAPGHSALYTGAVPRGSGIFGNDVIPPGASEGVSILADPKSRLVVAGQAAPAPAQPGASLASLAVDTLADVLAGHDPQAAIYSFSLKDRGALFGAGRHPTLALWFDPAAEAFVSSTAFTTAIPDWVTPLGGRDAVRAAYARGWALAPLDQKWVEAHALTPDPQPGEADYAGLGRIFPHPISSAKALRATPEGDELLLGLARAAVTRVAPAPHPTLLAISFSSNDYIGHMFGPDSWEAWDELRQLDHRLAQLLASLDSAVGPDGYAVMLSGDHGIGALPELGGAARQAACRRTAVTGAGADPDFMAANEKDCVPGRRLLAADVIAALEGAWQRELGINPSPPGAPGTSSTPGTPGVHLIDGIADAFVYLSARGRQLDAAARARCARAGTAALHGRFGIDHVVDVRAATAPCPPLADESRAALVCRSLRPSGPADFYLVVEPRTFFDARYTPGAGVNHGSPYLYDRAVPLLVRAPGRVAAGTVREQPVLFTAFVRTAASLLGLPPPAGAGEGENLAPPAPAPAAPAAQAAAPR